MGEHPALRQQHSVFASYRPGSPEAEQLVDEWCDKYLALDRRRGRGADGEARLREALGRAFANIAHVAYARRRKEAEEAPFMPVLAWPRDNNAAQKRGLPWRLWREMFARLEELGAIEVVELGRKLFKGKKPIAGFPTFVIAALAPGQAKYPWRSH